MSKGWRRSIKTEVELVIDIDEETVKGWIYRHVNSMPEVIAMRREAAELGEKVSLRILGDGLDDLSVECTYDHYESTDDAPIVAVPTPDDGDEDDGDDWPMAYSPGDT